MYAHVADRQTDRQIDGLKEETTVTGGRKKTNLECHMLKKMCNSIILFCFKSATCINPKTHLKDKYRTKQTKCLDSSAHDLLIILLSSVSANYLRLA